MIISFGPSEVSSEKDVRKNPERKSPGIIKIN